MVDDKYREYMTSDGWRKVRARYKRSALPQACIVCGNENVHLHHRTYERFGAEWVSDLVPLCQDHHFGWHKRNGHSLTTAERKLITDHCAALEKKSRSHWSQRAKKAKKHRAVPLPRNGSQKTVKKILPSKDHPGDCPYCGKAYTPNWTHSSRLVAGKVVCT